jgi:alpha-D-ribose 1-methylphosphonate 5-triphosphate synthase subunit PhnH
MRREVSYDEVFDAQAQFRIVMDAMARPGKINVLPHLDILPPEGLNEASALVALGLLNADVTFACSEVNADEIQSYLSVNTGAQLNPLEQGDYIFLTGQEDISVVEKVKVGTLSYPEQGATLIFGVSEISGSKTEGAVKIILKGPGIENTNTVFVTGINADLLNQIKIINQEFPLGVDLILTDVSNQLICIPRSNQFIIE